MKTKIPWPFEYSVIEITNLPMMLFVDQVNEKIREGWEPLGGITISERTDEGGDQRWSYAQAFRRPR